MHRSLSFYLHIRVDRMIKIYANLPNITLQSTFYKKTDIPKKMSENENWSTWIKAQFHCLNLNLNTLRWDWRFEPAIDINIHVVEEILYQISLTDSPWVTSIAVNKNSVAKKLENMNSSTLTKTLPRLIGSLYLITQFIFVHEGNFHERCSYK